MIFNGHTEETIGQISQERFYEIALMFVDGQLGNKGMFDALEPLTAGVWNYLAMGKKQFTSKDFFPVQHQYFGGPEVTSKNKEAETSLKLYAFAMSNMAKHGRTG